MKLDVIYSAKDIQRRLNDCKEKYTSKSIEECKNYLKTGDISKAFELINTKNEMFLVDDARFVDEINVLKACCDEAVDFYSLIENDALIDAFNKYINSKYLKKNNYLNDVFVKCVNEIVETLPSKIENLLNDNLVDEAQKLVNSYREYCSDKTLIDELNNNIDKHKFILKIESLEKQENWKEIIVIINNKKDSLNNYEIESKYENAKNKYINQICKKIDKYKEENDFDAINYELSNTIIDCTEFQRLNKEYKDKRNNCLYDYAYKSNGNISLEDTVVINDIIQRKVIKMDEGKYIEYKITDKMRNTYSQLTAKANFALTNNENKTITLKLYTDKSNQVYYLDYFTPNINMNISIDQAEYLRIEITSEECINENIYLYDLFLL